MKIEKLTALQAEAIVRGWLANVPAFFLKSSFNDAIMPGFNVRVWVAQYNKLASNALWDGQPNKAYALLLKHGMMDKARAYGANEVGYQRKVYQASTRAQFAMREMHSKMTSGPARIRRRAK